MGADRSDIRHDMTPIVTAPTPPPIPTAAPAPTPAPATGSVPIPAPTVTDSSDLCHITLCET